MNGYELSRQFFDWAFSNPEKIKPIHSAIYFFAIEHCNRLGWKEKFGFPSQMTMDAIGVKKYQTYGKALNDLENWGFIRFIERSKNQYSANIISINAPTKNGIAQGKALDKATIKHGSKHGHSIGQSTGQGMDSIDKPLNKEQINKEQRDFDLFLDKHKDSIQTLEPNKKNIFDLWAKTLIERDPTKLDRFSVPMLVRKFNSEDLKKLETKVNRSVEGGYKSLFETEEEKEQAKPKIQWG